MASSAHVFQQELGAELAAALGTSYRFVKSGLELRAQACDGHNVVVLSGSNRYSPFISLSFYFGRNFAAVKRIEKALGSHPFIYHVQQYSVNRKALREIEYAGPFTWSVDISSPPQNLASEIAAAVHGIADPFFERFSTIEAARDAIASGDHWCFSGAPFWRQLLLLDAALGDLTHFEHWANRLDDFTRTQAEEEISKVRVVASNAV